MKNNKGFSLVELIVVIAIMAILAAVAIPTFASFINKANKASDESFMHDVEYAVNLANAGNPDFDAGEISVTITNNKATAITYGDVTVDEDDADADTVEGDIYATIDWDYTFKNYEGTLKITDGVVSQ